MIEELDLVEEDDQYTHVLKLDDPDLDPEDSLSAFTFRFSKISSIFIFINYNDLYSASSNDSTQKH